MYSEWEADTYIPMLKDSWMRVMAVTSSEALGNAAFINLAADVEDYYAEVTVLQFMEMLSQCVEVAEDYESVFEIMKGTIVKPLARKGASAEHLNRDLGENLIIAMQTRLGSGFSSMDRGAWEFFFTWLASALEFGLELESGSKVTPISHSWDLAQDALSEEALGDLFYQNLVLLSPNLKDVFSAPRKILAMKFVEVMTTLATFHADKESNQQHLQWLGLRHVQYGVKPEHTQAVGEVLLATLEKAVGAEWTYEMDQAWRQVWDDACEILMSEVVNGRRYGQILQDAWEEVKRLTTEASFGAILRKNLLAGTEWVQALSVMAPVTSPSQPPGPGHASNGTPSRADSSAKDAAVGRMSKRGSLVSMQRSMTGTENSDSNDQLPNGSPVHENLPEGDGKASKKNTELQAQNIGTQFWELMNMLMRLMWEPENQHASLIVVTTQYFEHGTRTEHLENLGRAMCESFANVLRAGWTSEHSDAWSNWFWPKVSASMATTLDVLAEDHASVVERTWERAQERCSAEDLGDLFFNSLQKYAPHVCRIFKRPKKIQAFQFVTAVGWLVTFAKEPAAFFEELKPLTVRHVKYGVKADYVKGFGEAVLNALRLALEKEWDEECQKAWHTLWARLSGSVARSLHIGTNLIIVALVEGDLERLKDAVNCAPRKQRFDLLTKVDMNGEILSPLYWAIRDGKIAIAQFIINELLTIRADRLEYYYGRELLWAEHPDIVDVLCRDCPNLIEDFFDGLIWHSHTVVDGTVRVNYYIQELYGEPDESKDVWQSPLAMLTLIGKPNMFLHPVPSELLKIKWERFGQKIFVMTQLYFTVILILFNVGFVIYQNSCDEVFINLRLGVGSIAVINTLVFSYLSISQLRSGRVVMMGELCGLRMCLPRFLTNPWNFTRLFSYIILILRAFSEQCWMEGDTAPAPVRRKTGCPGGYNDPEVVGLETSDENPSWMLVISGISTFLIWIQLIQVLVLSPNLAAFTYTITRMFEDVSRNLMVISLIVVSFAGTLTVLHQPYYDTLQRSILNLLKIILGLSFLELESLEGWGLFTLIFFVVIIEIGFLNILIAQLALAYEELSADKEGFAMMSRAYMVVEMESFMPISYRQKIYEEFNFDKPLEFDGGDEGPAGGIQLKQPASMRAHEKYIPDRVIRYAGEASPNDPWPLEGEEEEIIEEVDLEYRGDDNPSQQ